MKMTGQTRPDSERQLASLPVAVVLLAPSLRIASANPAAEQFLGQSLRRLSGRKLTDVLGFAQQHLVERLSDSETPVSARDVTVSVAGIGPRRLDLVMAPVIDEPGWQLLTLHDSTAEALGEDGGPGEDLLLRGPEILAHEIKNPLAGIRGAAQLLGRKAQGGDRALTDLIAGEVDRIALLIDQMQALSRRTVAPVEPCNLHEAARRAIAVLDAADTGDKTGDRSAGCVRVIEEFDPSLPLVSGSPDGLVQVLINLLANAREACREVDGARIVIRTRFASGLQLHSVGSGDPVRLPIELRVTDNGPGVAPAMREHIFDPFVTTKKSGQGLGLALVRKLLREMNARISHERDEAAGLTHFRVHLPLAEERPARRSRGAQAA
jgi:two-component system nitrogen regulation sensor histidine kinase GlnL